MKTHTSNFKEQIKLIGKEIDSRIIFGSTVLGKNDLNAVTPSYQGAILKSVMKQLDIDSNVAIPIGTNLKYEFGLKVNGEYEYINYGNYIVYSIEKQEDTNSYKITCYDKLLYSMLDYVKLPITYPISIRDYINAISTVLGLKFANNSGTFANYDKQIQADLYNGLGYTFRDILDELAQVTASTICLNNNDELEIRYITETSDTIDEEYLKDVNINFGEKFGAVNTIVLSRSAGSDNIYYPEVLPANPYEIKISDNQIMNGNDRADFLPDIYNKLSGLEFYTNDFVSTGIVYYDLCDRYSVKVGDTTYSCVMFNDEVLVTQGLEENVYTEIPEQTETDYKHASKDDRMINQVYIIAKKNEAEILAVVNTTNQIQKEINPTKDESGSSITIEDASDNPLIKLEIEGKSTQKTRSGKNLMNVPKVWSFVRNTQQPIFIPAGTYYISMGNVTMGGTSRPVLVLNNVAIYLDSNKVQQVNFSSDITTYSYYSNGYSWDGSEGITSTVENLMISVEGGEYEEYGVSPNPDYPSEIESVGYENLIPSYEMWERGDISSSNNGTNINSGYYIRTIGYIKVKSDTSYSFSFLENKGTLQFSIYEYDENYNYIDRFFNTKIFTTNTNAVYIRISIRYVGTELIINVDDVVNGKFVLNIGEKSYPYIPYGKYGVVVETTNVTDTNTLVIVLNEPLRSLPNGVKDIAYIKNNRLYVDRYVKSTILNGSENWTYSVTYKYYQLYFSNNNRGIANSRNIFSNYFTGDGDLHLRLGNTGVMFWITDNNDYFEQNVDTFKTWLSTHNTQVDYELATPYTEELGEIQMPSTFKGTNHILTTDELLPIINLTYVRDTIIADYVENHIAELKITEGEIKESVEKVSSSVDGLNTSINRVEEITNDNSQVINIISTNIDKTSGEVREVTTTTGFTFNADGMTIDDGSGFKAQHRATGTYYKDGESITGQYTKDGSKQKDLELFGTYSYGKESIDDTPMFVGQLYNDENGEECFGHFYNGGDY